MIAGFHVHGLKDRRQGAHRRDRHAARRHPHAGLHAGRHRRRPSRRMTVDQVAATGADIVLGNTYHLMLRPGAERVARLGGLHRFMRWQQPILTDSGGFQVMSLSDLRKIDEEGVTFQSHIDGAAMRCRRSARSRSRDLLGSDIQMQLDECVALPAPTDAWARPCGARCAGPSARRPPSESSPRWQGSVRHRAGRRPSAASGAAERLQLDRLRRLRHRRPGGRRAAGAMCEDARDSRPHMLPGERPRYLMGVGKPIDIVEAVSPRHRHVRLRAADRSGRHGQVFTRLGASTCATPGTRRTSHRSIRIGACSASNTYSKAYLHHLVRSNEILGMMLLTWHNLAYYQEF